MVVKDLAKAVDALANAATLLRQSGDRRAIDLAVSVVAIQDAVATRRGELIGGAN